jgi:aspartate aminotransferase/aminotransferase
MDYKKLLAQRATEIEASGIRKIFDLAATVKNAINLSIGQPDFDVPEPLKELAIASIRSGFNGYPPSPGLPELRKLVLDHHQELHGFRPDDCLITSGTSGALTLGLLALVNPGDEVLIPDPHFVSYKHLTTICGGTKVFYDTYPNFQADPAKIEKLITSKTKLMIVMSPGNPTGACIPDKTKRDLADLARAKGVIVLADEVYEQFQYSGVCKSLSAYYPEGTLACGGLSKTSAMTGWRLGWVSGPRDIVAEMIKLQQFTFVCAPSTAQKAALGAFKVDLSAAIAHYRQKRDLMVGSLRRCGYECEEPGGAFYLFPRVPKKYANSQKFVEDAIAKRLMLVPGHAFSQRDTNFRISYAASDPTLSEALEVFKTLA